MLRSGDAKKHIEEWQGCFSGANPKWTLGKIQSDIFADSAEKRPTSDGNADGN